MNGKCIFAGLLVVWSLLGGLSGCGATEATSGTVVVDPKARWLAGEPCRPPCWENIQPGVTRPEEAIDLLKASPIIDPATVQVEELTDIDAGLVFWKFSSADTSWTGKVGYISKPNSVRVITLTVPDLCLREIIGAYGKPDYLYLLAYKVIDQVDLIWQSYGFLYEKKLSSPAESITETICGGTVQQFPVDTTFQNIPSPIFMDVSDEHFVPWIGYGNYGK